MFKFLQLPDSIHTCKMTGKWVNGGEGYGEKAVAWMKRIIDEEMKNTEKMKDKCLKWNSSFLP